MLCYTMLNYKSILLDIVYCNVYEEYLPTERTGLKVYSSIL